MLKSNGTIYEYRITRYDPAKRNLHGAFQEETWTSIHDVGKSFSGVELTLEEYQRAEDTYIHTVLSFLEESGVEGLIAYSVESDPQHSMLFREGEWLSRERLGDVFREVLQEKYWCRFRDEVGRFIHFGYDYYMYIGVAHSCAKSQRFAADLGLFVEEFTSPYNT